MYVCVYICVYIYIYIYIGRCRLGDGEPLGAPLRSLRGHGRAASPAGGRHGLDDIDR